ncbi:hypothetical protein AB7W58_22895 [Providencia rettgeri]
MDIKIENPIKITLETIGIEDCYSSIEFKITLAGGGINHHQSIELTTWITYSCFDDFIKNINKKSEAILIDISDNFYIKLNIDFIECSFSYENYDFSHLSLFKIKCTLNNSYHKIVEAFNDYPRWW